MRMTNQMLLGAEVNQALASKVFFPFADGSGDDVTDVIAGITVSDAATAEHTVPHAIQFTRSGGTNVTGGLIPNVESKQSMILLNVQTAGVLTAAGLNCSFGNTSVGADFRGITNSGSAGIKLTSSNSVSASFGAVSNGQTIARATVFNGVSGLLSAYGGINGAASALINSADASAHIVPDGTIVTFEGSNDSIPIGDTALSDVKTYGIALYIFNGEPPAASVINAAVDWCYKNWTKGRKILPPQLAGL